MRTHCNEHNQFCALQHENIRQILKRGRLIIIPSLADGTSRRTMDVSDHKQFANTNIMILCFFHMLTRETRRDVQCNTLNPKQIKDKGIDIMQPLIGDDHAR